MEWTTAFCLKICMEFLLMKTNTLLTTTAQHSENSDEHSNGGRSSSMTIIKCPQLECII